MENERFQKTKYTEDYTEHTASRMAKKVWKSRTRLEQQIPLKPMDQKSSETSCNSFKPNRRADGDSYLEKGKRNTDTRNRENNTSV